MNLLQPRCDKCGNKIKPKAKESAKAKATRARKRADDERKRQLRARKSAALYGKVMDRPGWACELGGHAPLTHIELHHLKAGSAKRFYETEQNCIRACGRCHREWHGNGAEQFRARVQAWCEHNRYPLPSVFLREPRATRALSGPSPVHGVRK